jgi:hypothetical protein
VRSIAGGIPIDLALCAYVPSFREPPTILKLTISTIFSPAGREIDEMFYLSRLPSLKRFHIYLLSNTDPGDEGIDDQLPWFVDFLEHSVTTDTHPLEDLSIEQCIDCEDDDDEIEEHLSDIADGWSQITHILINSGHFPNLKSFKLRIFSFVPGLGANAVQLLQSRDFFKQLNSRIGSVVIFTEGQGELIFPSC